MSAASSHDPLSVAKNESAPKRLVWAAQIAFIPTGILTTLLGPMLPILIARWALSDAQAGNLFLIQFLASLVGVQLSGVLLGRLGFRAPFLLGLLLMAVGIATIYMGSLWLGLASVAAYGLGLGFIIPTDNLLIAEISTGSRAGALSLLNFFWGVGAVMCSLSIAWSNAHKLLPLLLGSVALLLVLLALGVRHLPFPGPRSPAGPLLARRVEVRSKLAILLFPVARSGRRRLPGCLLSFSFCIRERKPRLGDGSGRT